MPQLADLYNADKRTRDPVIRRLAARNTIPHPLSNVQYADGVAGCTHAKKHQRFEHCPRTPSPVDRSGSIPPEIYDRVTQEIKEYQKP